MKKLANAILCVLFVLCLTACSVVPLGNNSGSSGHLRPRFGTIPQRPDDSQTETGGDGIYHDEMKGVFFSQFDLSRILKGVSEATFVANIQKAFDHCVSMGLNTVVVQVRPYSDSFYPSDLFPWSNYVSGTLGKAPGFDPLEIMVEQAHARGLSFHAWVNPMRGMTDSDLQKIGNQYAIKQWYTDQTKYQNYIFKHTDNRWYYNPAIGQVRQLIANGVKEIVQNYAVDAVLIDDYFYPSGVANTSDSTSYSAYTASGGKLALADWRRENVNQMVKSMYQTIKSVDARVYFGISPAGNMSNNYNRYYADVALWMKTPGYLDYIAPQIYYSYDSSYSANSTYTKALKEFDQMEKHSGVDMVIALASYKLGGQDSSLSASEKPLWTMATDITKRQVTDARQVEQYGGFLLYRYDSLFNPANASHVQQEIKNLKTIL